MSKQTLSHKLYRVLEGIAEKTTAASQKMENINKKIQTQNILFKALAESRLQVHAEKCVIELSLETALRKVKIQEMLSTMTEKEKSEYHNIRAKYSNAVTSETNEIQNRSPTPIATFFSTLKTNDPEIIDLINQQLADIKQERDSFLTKIQKRIDKNAPLQLEMQKALSLHNCQHFWELIKPR